MRRLLAAVCLAALPALAIAIDHGKGITHNVPNKIV